MVKSRCQMSKSIVQILCHLLGLSVCVQFVLASSKQPSELGGHKEFGMTLYLIVVSVFAAVPNRLWRKTVPDAFMFAVTVVAITEHLYHTADHKGLFARVWLRLFLGVLTPRLTSSIIINFVGVSIDALVGKMSCGLPMEDIWPLFVMTAGNVGVCFTYNYLDKIRCCSVAMAENATKGEDRAQSLLSRLCEAVVTLDDNLRLTMPSPKLAALLLHPTEATCGRALTDFLVQEDRSLFEHFVRNQDEFGGSRQLVVRFSSGTSQRVKCELHHVRFMHLHLDGHEEVWHILGVCELGDNTWVGCGNTNINENSPILEAPPEVANTAHRINEVVTGVEAPQHVENDWQQVGEPRDELSRQSSCSSDMTRGLPQDKDQNRFADDVGNATMTIQWNKCEVRVLNARRKLVIKVDTAAHDSFMNGLTQWKSTHDFLQQLMTQMVEALCRLDNFKAKLGCSLNCNVSFCTSLHVTDQMLKRKETRRCFTELVPRPSKLASISQKQSQSNINSTDVEAGSPL